MDNNGRFSKLEIGEAKPEKKNASVEITEEERGAEYYKQIADRCYEEGDHESSLKYYSRVLEFDRNSIEAWLGQVRCLIELDEFKEGNIWCEKALERFANNPELLAAKAVIYARIKELSKARAYSDSSLEKENPSAYIWLARGEVFITSRGKNYEYCFDKAITENLKDWFLYFSIAKVCMYYKKPSLAMKYFVRALELNASSPFLYFQTGMCYETLGIYNNAAFCYEQSLVLKSNYLEAKRALESITNRGFFSKLFRRN